MCIVYMMQKEAKIKKNSKQERQGFDQIRFPH
jgi:hypothetical protein